MKTNAILAASAVLLSGCTTELTVVRADPQTPVAGVLYYMPVGIIESTMSRVLTDCSMTDNGPVLDVETSGDARALDQADTTNAYLLPYESFNTALKKTTFATTLYENGTLKSINVAIQDRTSAVLANLGKTAINIARMVAGLPPGAGGGKPIKEACNEKTRV